MLKSILIPSCAILTLGIVGCATTTNPSTERHLNELQNKNWVVSEVYGVALSPDPTQSDVPSIQFDNERVSGSDGCNRFMGGYAVKGTKIQLSNLASTKKACLNATNIPQKFIQALGEVTTYNASKKELKFIDANNKTVLKFKNVK